MIITIEDYISWRKSNKGIYIRYIAGDTAVLSISKNGIDCLLYTSDAADDLSV